MRVYKREESAVWWASFSVNGRQYKFSTKRTNKKEAERVAHKKYTDLLDRTQGITQPTIKLADAFDTVIATAPSKEHKNRIEVTKRKLLGLSDKKPKPFSIGPASLRLDELTQGMVNKLIVERTKEGLKPNSINAELRCLSLVYNRMKKVYRCEPHLEFKLLKGASRTRWLRPDEVRDVLAAIQNSGASPNVRRKAAALMMTLVSTGLRLSDTLQLQWADIDGNARTVTTLNSKTKTWNQTTIASSALDALMEFKDEPQPFVRMGHAVRVLRDCINKVCNDPNDPTKARRMEQEGAAVIHSLRDTFATLCLQRGLTLFDVQKLLNHASPRMTQKYAHLTSSEAVSRAHQLGVFE